MQKTLLISFVFFLLACILFSPHLAYAHFPATDGTMIITLHIEPNDQPIPQEKAALYFLFDDKTNKFKLVHCTCIVSISEQGKRIFAKQLVEKKNSQPSIWGASMGYTFPSRDVYHIVVTGKPTIPNAFQPFSLSWDFRVDSESSGPVSQGPSDLQIIIIVTLVAIAFVVFSSIFMKKQIDAEEVDNTKKRGYTRKRR